MIVHAFEVEDWERDYFGAIAQDHELRLWQEPLSPRLLEQCRDAEILSTFIYSKLDEKSLREMPQLKMITTRSTGYEHIPVAACRERGITVCNVPTYGSNTVAEHVFGLLLTLSHNLEQAIDRTRKGDFSLRGLQGFDLFGKTMGVLGTGDIGVEVIRIARGFGMRVLAYDLREKQDLAHEMGFKYVQLDAALAESDVISLHVPSTPQTRHLLNDAAFAKMKEGVVIINTARGELIDTTALLRALAEGKVRAAGLDVLAEEPVIREEAELLRSVYERKHDLQSLLANHVLVHMRNVVVTPHSAFYTREAQERILQTTFENIRAFAEGSAKNVVGR